MVRIRLCGTWSEVKSAQKQIENVFHVLYVSEPFTDRGKTEYWRVYIDCEERSKEDDAGN